MFLPTMLYNIMLQGIERCSQQANIIDMEKKSFEVFLAGSIDKEFLNPGMMSSHHHCWYVIGARMG